VRAHAIPALPTISRHAGLERLDCSAKLQGKTRICSPRPSRSCGLWGQDLYFARQSGGPQRLRTLPSDALGFRRRVWEWVATACCEPRRDIEGKDKQLAALNYDVRAQRGDARARRPLNRKPRSNRGYSPCSKTLSRPKGRSFCSCGCSFMLSQRAPYADPE
jgi:hypothetical protein